MSELERITVEEFAAAPKIPISIVLDNVRSANNVGAIFRTADAFAIEHIYLCGITACPPHKEIRKTALGAELSVPFTYFESAVECVQTLKAANYSIASIEQAEQSTHLQHFAPQPQKHLAIVLGNEVEGVQQDILNLSHECIEIPQFGTKHSFNVSVTCGIVLWELTKSYTNRQL